MARRCEFTGKGVLVGNNVSHANNKTKKRFLPNVQKVRFFSQTMGAFFSFRVCVNAIRSVDKKGGLDSFLIEAKKNNLSLQAKKLREKILAKSSKSAA